jgi:hypothetical protein
VAAVFWQLSLEQALEASSDRKAYRIGAPSGVWVVEQQEDSSYRLLHYPDVAPGSPPEPVQHWAFPSFEQLLAGMQSIPYAFVVHTDWYPNTGEV